jgi:hypothetical protein
MRLSLIGTLSTDGRSANSRLAGPSVAAGAAGFDVTRPQQSNVMPGMLLPLSRVPARSE